jgi:hypothetical protein
VFCFAVLRQGMKGGEGTDVNLGIRSKDFSYRSVLIVSSVHLQVMENPGLCSYFQFHILPHRFQMNAEIRLQMGYKFFLTYSYLFVICRFSSCPIQQRRRMQLKQPFKIIKKSINPHFPAFISIPLSLRDFTAS